MDFNNLFQNGIHKYPLMKISYKNNRKKNLNI